MDTAPSKWKEVSVLYDNHGEYRRKESRSSSAPRTIDNNDRSNDDEAFKERDRARASRMGEISSTERAHIGTSPAGFHVKLSAVVVTIDSNGSSSGKVGDRVESDITRHHGSRDRYDNSRTSSPSPRNSHINKLKKSSSRTSTDDDGSVSPIEGASLGGTGLKVTMKKLSGKMFFAATRDDAFKKNCFDKKPSNGEEEKVGEEAEVKEDNRSKKEGQSVALLVYPLFEMKSDVDFDDCITMSNNVVNSSLNSGTGGIHGKGTGTGNSDSSGTPLLSAPVIPFRDLFYFNAHLIDIGMSPHDMVLLHIILCDDFLESAVL